MDAKKLQSQVEADFEAEVLPGIKDFVRIPNVSPGFDPEWETNGLADKAVNHIVTWINNQKLAGCTVKVLKEPKRTHTILVVVEPTKPESKNLFFYGHCDKQPPCTEQWRKGLDPYTPTVEGTRLYGRGSSDDGYAAFAIVSAIKACQKLGIPHDRCVVMIESCEESGSKDLGYYLEQVKDVVKTPDLMFIMDSGCGDYERIWLTTSLRGNLKCDFKVTALKEGVHSGDAGGIVPETFEIVRALLDRIDDPKTGRVVDTFQVKVPEGRLKEVADAAKLLGSKVYDHFPFIDKVSPMSKDPYELLLNKTWLANMSVIGAEGLPLLKNAGNVLRPETSLRISIRIPPTLDAKKGAEDLKKILTENPPYGAKVEVLLMAAGPGLNCPEMTPGLSKIIKDASQHFYNNDPIYYGEGGSIPFLSSLATQFPKSQFFISGVLGPESNAHGANEMLELSYTKKLICSVAYIIAKFHEEK
eukprot:TRINITY_DN10437_c0_g1_i5.p1 TRINITY_DN10437_c0_g1~~TRINITY_DN10437_c0_g1_i5.p1  ORF type:complete len:472 (-),score=168.49 TRINITY_DN10437_c0_g1_i5:63-1478(-)